MRTRILLVDDHAILREGLRMMFERITDYQTVAEASDGKTAIHLVQDLSPDLILMDISMPEMNGIDATEEITATNTTGKIIGFSASLDKQSVLAMLKAGAVGYVPKICQFNELVIAIRAVLSNQMYISPYVASHVVDEVKQDSNRSITALSGREREVFFQLVNGLSVKEIAQQLSISIKTVNTHRQHVMERLGVASMVDLVKYALREGLIEM
ncbi:MAG TPA: response regulator transcription factor [Armatimonadota bacterium]|nr:response regulator transcription factor [Armatimonadota bacterium]